MLFDLPNEDMLDEAAAVAALRGGYIRPVWGRKLLLHGTKERNISLERRMNQLERLRSINGRLRQISGWKR